MSDSGRAAADVESAEEALLPRGKADNGVLQGGFASDETIFYVCLTCTAVVSIGVRFGMGAYLLNLHNRLDTADCDETLTTLIFVYSVMLILMGGLTAAVATSVLWLSRISAKSPRDASPLLAICNILGGVCAQILYAVGVDVLLIYSTVVLFSKSGPSCSDTDAISKCKAAIIGLWVMEPILWCLQLGNGILTTVMGASGPFSSGSMLSRGNYQEALREEPKGD